MSTHRKAPLSSGTAALRFALHRNYLANSMAIAASSGW